MPVQLYMEQWSIITLHEIVMPTYLPIIVIFPLLLGEDAISIKRSIHKGFSHPATETLQNLSVQLTDILDNCS